MCDGSNTGLGVEILRLDSASSGLGFTQPQSLGLSHLQNKIIPVPFSLLPMAWEELVKRMYIQIFMSCKSLHKSVIITTVISEK